MLPLKHSSLFWQLLRIPEFSGSAGRSLLHQHLPTIAGRATCESRSADYTVYPEIGCQKTGKLDPSLDPTFYNLFQQFQKDLE